MTKDMSVVRHVVIFLGSGNSIPTLLGYGLPAPFSKKGFSFLLHVSKFYTSLKVGFKSHLLVPSPMNSLFTELFQHYSAPL